MVERLSSWGLGSSEDASLYSRLLSGASAVFHTHTWAPLRPGLPPSMWLKGNRTGSYWRLRDSKAKHVQPTNRRELGAAAPPAAPSEVSEQRHSRSRGALTVSPWATQIQEEGTRTLPLNGKSVENLWPLGKKKASKPCHALLRGKLN